MLSYIFTHNLKLQCFCLGTTNALSKRKGVIEGIN